MYIGYWMRRCLRLRAHLRPAVGRAFGLLSHQRVPLPVQHTPFEGMPRMIVVAGKRPLSTESVHHTVYLTTRDNVQGREIQEECGVVIGSSFKSRNILFDLFCTSKQKNSHPHSSREGNVRRRGRDPASYPYSRRCHSTRCL